MIKSLEIIAWKGHTAIQAPHSTQRSFE